MMIQRMRRFNTTPATNSSMIVVIGVVIVVLLTTTSFVAVINGKGGVVAPPGGEQWRSLSSQEQEQEQEKRSDLTTTTTTSLEWMDHDTNEATTTTTTTTFIDENGNLVDWSSLSSSSPMEGLFSRRLLPSFKREGCQRNQDCIGNQGNQCLRAGICRNIDNKCYYESVTCDDGNKCSTDYCDSLIGCLSKSKCEDNDACTIDTCDGGTGTCMYTMTERCALTNTVFSRSYTIPFGAQQIFTLNVPSTSFVFCQSISDKNNGDIDLHMSWDTNFDINNSNQCFSSTKASSREQCSLNESLGTAYVKITAVQLTSNYQVRCGYVTQKQTSPSDMQVATTETFALNASQYWVRSIPLNVLTTSDGTGKLFSEVTCSSTGNNNEDADLTMGTASTAIEALSANPGSSNEIINLLFSPLQTRVFLGMYAWQPSSGSATCQQSSASPIPLTNQVSAGPFTTLANYFELFSLTVPANATQVICTTTASGTGGDLKLNMNLNARHATYGCTADVANSPNETCTLDFPANTKFVYAITQGVKLTRNYNVLCRVSK